jgi:O-antigen/teichoic acid export membrane protein
MKDLKHRVIRGGVAKFCSQGTTFVVRMGSLMILARLLDPKDFGLVGMVTAVTGVFNVFRDFGLSAAAVQRTTVTKEQASTLFWINLLVGAILGLLVAAMAPFVVRFYREPRLFGVTIALATAFLFNAAGVQQSAILERQIRVLGSCCFHNRDSTCLHRVRLANDRLGPRKTTQRDWHPFHDAFWRHSHFEWPGHVYCYQL